MIKNLLSASCRDRIASHSWYHIMFGQTGRKKMIETWGNRVYGKGVHQWPTTPMHYGIGNEYILSNNTSGGSGPVVNRGSP